MSASPLVSVEGLSRAYGDRLALDRVSFDVAPGELFALLGPNGGGKTTLFKLLATLIPPSDGTFRVDGLSPDGPLRELRRRLGVVFQSPSLDRKLTVLENLLVHGAILGLGGRDVRARSGELLARMGVDDRARDLVETLSGGLARRVEIAKALLGAPKVLLLDEPSTGLDPLARRNLRSLLADLARGGTTVLLTTHLFDEAEEAGRIGILDHGRLVALGAPADLKRDVGGDVLVLTTESEETATALAADVAAFLGPGTGPGTGSNPGPEAGPKPGRVCAIGSTVRVEHPDGPSLVPALAATFAGRFRSLTLGAPSLEDVFVDRTGHPFDETGEVEERAA
jgi:ABC-2 type transport system ATP-binding protein